MLKDYAVISMISGEETISIIGTRDTIAECEQIMKNLRINYINDNEDCRVDAIGNIVLYSETFTMRYKIIKMTEV